MSNQDILNMIKELEANGHTPTFILYKVKQALDVSPHIHISETVDMSGVSIQEYSEAVDKATSLIKDAINKNKKVNDDY